MPVDQPLYPVNLVLAGRSCLVVGGGRVALTKVRGLADVGARVTVVAPEVVPEVAAVADVVELRPYRPGEAAGYRFVIAATGGGFFGNPVTDDSIMAFGLPQRK